MKANLSVIINGSTTLKSYCNFKVTLKNMVNYERSTWKIYMYSLKLTRKLFINKNVIFEEKRIPNKFNNFLLILFQT